MAPKTFFKIKKAPLVGYAPKNFNGNFGFSLNKFEIEIVNCLGCRPLVVLTFAQFSNF